MPGLRWFLGQAIRGVRKARDLTLNQLAESVTGRRAVGAKVVGVDTVSRLERGLSNYKIDTLDEYIAALDVTWVDFFKMAESIASEQQVTFLDHQARSTDNSIETLLELSMERVAMSDKTALQMDVVRLASAIQPEDAKAAFDALSNVFARRGLHESGPAETSG